MLDNLAGEIRAKKELTLEHEVKVKRIDREWRAAFDDETARHNQLREEYKKLQEDSRRICVEDSEKISALQQQIETLKAEATQSDVATSELLLERDQAEERLDRLIAAVCPEGQAGEHSSANDPLLRAIDFVEQQYKLLRMCRPNFTAIEKIFGPARSVADGVTYWAGGLRWWGSKELCFYVDGDDQLVHELPTIGGLIRFKQSSLADRFASGQPCSREEVTTAMTAMLDESAEALDDAPISRDDIAYYFGQEQRISGGVSYWYNGLSWHHNTGECYFDNGKSITPVSKSRLRDIYAGQRPAV